MEEVVKILYFELFYFLPKNWHISKNKYCHWQNMKGLGTTMYIFYNCKFFNFRAKY